MYKSLLYTFVVFVTLLICEQQLKAQGTNITYSVPFQTNRESYAENFNSSWSLRGPGFNMSFNNANAGQPPFGNYNPNVGLTSGWQTRSGPYTGNFNFNLGQSIQRSSISQTPVITSMPGVPSSITIGTQRPFVTSVVPTVNQGFRGPVVQSPIQMIQERLRNGELPAGGLSLRTPQHPRMPDVDIDAQRVHRPTAEERLSHHRIDPLPPTRAERNAILNGERSARNNAADAYLKKGLTAEAQGKPGVAKVYYRLGLKQAEGELKKQLQSRLNQLSR